MVMSLGKVSRPKKELLRRADLYGLVAVNLPSPEHQADCGSLPSALRWTKSVEELSVQPTYSGWFYFCQLNNNNLICT
jgi:hypothetical protein